MKQSKPTAGVMTSNLGRMIVLSLLAHALFSTAFIITHGGRPGAPAIQYLDLKMAQPTTAPAEKGATKAPVPLHREPEQTLPSPTAEETAPQAAQAPPPPAPAETFQQGSLGYGIVNGHFGSISDGRTLRDDMREYYLGMLAKFNEAWWKNAAGDPGGPRGAVFLAVVARDGSLVDLKLLQSSGNPTHDRTMLRSLKAAGPLNPLPGSYESDFFTAPLRFVAPLNLMTPFSG